jgi:hypothetical protein
MSSNTKLIVKIIETRAAIEDSDPLKRFGISHGGEWAEHDRVLAIAALEDLLAAANAKLRELRERKLVKKA